MNIIVKRLLGGAMALCLALTPAVAAFADTEGHWAASSIDKWSEQYGIIKGYEEDATFRPDAPITRGAFAGILDRVFHFTAASPSDTFSDIEGNYWEEAILKLHASGVYLGTAGKALAGNSITRQQAVAMIARAFRIDAEVLDLPYSDAGQIAEYAAPVVAEFTIRHYIDDCFDGAFRPTDPITRAEIVNLLGNVAEVLVQDTSVFSEDVAGNVLINSVTGAKLSDMTIAGDLMLAPGVQGEVVLESVTVNGRIRNFSGVEPTIIQKQAIPVKPAGETLLPSDVYTPGETTGKTIMYSGKSCPVYAGRDVNIFSNTDFYWEGDRLIYNGNDFTTRFGIDVSAYQNRSSANETIDWNAVRADGVEFAMVRIGLRGTSTGAIHADAYYARNIDDAMAAGIDTGVYFFAQAVTVEEAVEEADFVIDLLKGHTISGPVAYDWEMQDSSYRVYGTEPEMATACAVAFCKRIAEAGYTPMVYAGTYVSYIKYDQGALSPYLSWYPEYKSEKSEKLCPSLYYHMDYWQFTSSCAIAGIGGRVDANLQFIR